jgi:hypothetical protein
MAAIQAEQPICPQAILAGTGIPEEFRRHPGDSGGICRNQGQIQEFTGTCVKFLLTWPKTGIFLPLPKRGSCEKIPPEKKNPEES